MSLLGVIRYPPGIAIRVKKKKGQEKQSKPAGQPAIPQSFSLTIHSDWRATDSQIPLALVSRALRLVLEPIHNARLVELAEAVEADQILPNLILNQADRAFGHAAIFCEAVLLGRREWQHAGRCGRRAWRGRGLAEVHVLGLTVDRRGAVAGDALADVRFAGVLGMLIAERREQSGTDGAKVVFRDLGDSGRGEDGGRQVFDGGGTGLTASVTEAGHGARDRSAGRLAEALQDRGAVVGAHGSSLLARGRFHSLYSLDIRLVY